jgi:GT2 family glycosyltransferase
VPIPISPKPNGPAALISGTDGYRPLADYQLVLLVVAFHPSLAEVEQLQACLADLPMSIGYAVVVNDHRPGQVVERLEAGAVAFLTNTDNPGYGRAVNRLVKELGSLPPYIGVLNTDLAWQSGSFEKLLAWLKGHSDVSLATPQILNSEATPQKLCKQHPTLLGLLSRRFVPEWLKPEWLKHYDRWYVMEDQDYQQVFDVPYLSGCCMLMRSDAFRHVGGFDERYFLYLEDADLSRSLSQEGRCVHLPIASVVHGWGRGNHRSMRLTLVNIHSAWLYFNKWGWRWW